MLSAIKQIIHVPFNELLPMEGFWGLSRFARRVEAESILHPLCLCVQTINKVENNLFISKIKGCKGFPRKIWGLMGNLSLLCRGQE